MSVESFTYAKWIENGELEETVETKVAELDDALIGHFRKALKNLSGDLELPYEAGLPGEISHCEYRIGSDLKGGAYVMFYFHDAIATTTVMLQGTNEHHEKQLLETIKCLLLEPDDIDEAEDMTDEELDELLASEAFDFASIERRPAVFSVLYDLEPAEPEAMAFIEKMNLHMAAAFMEVGR
jgi:hypothetical protein